MRQIVAGVGGLFASVDMRLSPAELLGILLRLRAWALGLVAVSLVLLPAFMPSAIAVLPMGGFFLGLAVWQLLAWWRIRRRWPVTAWEVTGHLLMDSGLVFLLMFLSGGSASPFVSLILVPIGLASAALPAASAWTLLFVAAGGYSLLIWALPPHAQHGGDAFYLHVLGMWVTFLFAALLLVVFVSAMAAAARRREAALADTREQMLRSEQLSRIGGLVAGAAHELGTPLSTARTLLADVRRKAAGDDELESDLDNLARQLEICGDRLNAALVGRDVEAADRREVDVGAWMASTLERWRGMRPGVRLEVDMSPDATTGRLCADDSLSHMLTSLLDNAADASLRNGSDSVTLRLECGHALLNIHIEDHGTGLSPADRARAGRVRFTSKRDGHGLGLVLSHAAMDRIGGQLSLSDRPGGGTRTTISLPLESSE